MPTVGGIFNGDEFSGFWEEQGLLVPSRVYQSDGDGNVFTEVQSEDAIVDGVLVRGARKVFTLEPCIDRRVTHVLNSVVEQDLALDRVVIAFDEVGESGELYDMFVKYGPLDGNELFLEPLLSEGGERESIGTTAKYRFIAGADWIEITGSLSPKSYPPTEEEVLNGCGGTGLCTPINKVVFPFVKIEIELAGASRGLAHVQRFNGYGNQISSKLNGSKRLNYQESFTSVQPAWGKEKSVVTLETGAEVLITSPVGGNAGGKPAALPYPDLMVRAFDDDGEPVAIGRFTTEADGRTRLPEGGWLYFANSSSGPLGAGGTAGVKKIELTGDPALPYNPRFSRNYVPGDPAERLYSYTVTAVRMRTTEVGG